MRVAVLLYLLFCSPGIAQVRTWTDASDRTIQATFLRQEGDRAILKLQDGREVAFPLEKLSTADREFVGLQPVERAEHLPGESGDGPSEKGSAPLNFDSPWPERITYNENPAISTVEENPAEKRFIYESANYRYICDVRLAQSVVKGFAVMFEATNLYCGSLPLGLNGGSAPSGKHRIYLFETQQDYIKAGGIPDSAGVFISGKENRVMVPLTSLGVRPVGSGYMLDRDRSSKTLPHELTHQLTPGVYFSEGSRGWFTEGLAEYIAVTPYRSGAYNVRSNFRDIVEYVTAYGDKERGGRALGKEITLPALESFMLQSYAEFMEGGQISYGSALLITTYFFHLDGEGDAKRIVAFLKALREGKKGKEALAALLDGRTFEELEKDIIREWGRKGVKFTFLPGKH